MYQGVATRNDATTREILVHRGPAELRLYGVLGSSLRSAAKEIDEEIRLRAKEMGCADALSGDLNLSHALSGLSPGRRHP